VERRGRSASPDNKYVFAGIRLKLVRVACGLHAVALLYVRQYGTYSAFRGDEADRRRWRIKGSGGRENNERTRGHLCRRRARQLFFRGRRPGEPPRYTRMTGSCFCFAKPLCRYASPRFWLLLTPKVTARQRYKYTSYDFITFRRLRYLYSGIFPEPLLCILLLCICDSSPALQVQNDNPPTASGPPSLAQGGLYGWKVQIEC